MPVYTFTTLNDPLAPDRTLAHGINGSGQIVGQYTNNNTGTNGFLLSAGTYTTIADPLDTQHLTESFGINDAGQIVGLYATGPTATHGFLYNPTNGAYTTSTIPRPPKAPLRSASTIGARSSAFTSLAAPSRFTAFS